MSNRIIRIHALDIVSGEEVYVRYDADAKILYDDSGVYTAPHQINTALEKQLTAIEIKVVSDA